MDYCTKGRQNAKRVFESDLYKLMANSTFGKSMQNDRHHKNYRLMADPDKLLKAVSKPTMKSVQIINSDLSLVENVKRSSSLEQTDIRLLGSGTL